MANQEETAAGQDSGESPSQSEEDSKRSAYDAEMAPWKERYDGRVTGFPCGKHGLLVVHFARGAVYRNFKKRASELNDKNDHEAKVLLDVELVKNCACLPADKAALHELLEDYPTLVPTAAMEIIKLSGMDVEPLGKA